MIKRIISIIRRCVNAAVPVQLFDLREPAQHVGGGAPLPAALVLRGYHFTAGAAAAAISQSSLRAVRIRGGRRSSFPVVCLQSVNPAGDGIVTRGDPLRIHLGRIRLLRYPAHYVKDRVLSAVLAGAARMILRHGAYPASAVKDLRRVSFASAVLDC